MCLGLNGQDAATVQLMTASGDDSSYVHLYVIAVQETCFMACRIVMQVCKRWMVIPVSLSVGRSVFNFCWLIGSIFKYQTWVKRTRDKARS